MNTSAASDEGEMMELTLQDSEVQLLERVLRSTLGDLRMEITDTEKFEMRESMKKDEEVLKSIIRRLNPAAPL